VANVNKSVILKKGTGKIEHFFLLAYGLENKIILHIAFKHPYSKIETRLNSPIMVFSLTAHIM
jgi:hypothetical protein